MRRHPTKGEVLLTSMLNFLGFKFARQQVFTAPTLKSYIADFWVWNHKLIVECDGVTHETCLAVVNDSARDARFKEAGIRTLRITRQELRGMSPQALFDKIIQ